jgi:hypothetical protein
MPFSNLSPNSTADPTQIITFTWSQDYGTQTHYQLLYRKEGDAVWVDSGKVTSAVAQHSVSANTLLKNAKYEWKVRVWYGTASESPWSYKETFVSEVPALDLLTLSTSGGNKNIRVVPLAKSNVASNVRVSTPGGTGELDLLATGATAESGLRIATATGVVRGVAKKLDDWYSNYANHSDTGYNAYGNHSNSGYAAYNNFTNTGYSAYGDTYNNYCTVTVYCDGGYANTCAGPCYQRYSNFSNTGYTAYNNHSNSGYAAYGNHADTN